MQSLQKGYELLQACTCQGQREGGLPHESNTSVGCRRRGAGKRSDFSTGEGGVEQEEEGQEEWKTRDALGSEELGRGGMKREGPIGDL